MPASIILEVLGIIRQGLRCITNQPDTFITGNPHVYILGNSSLVINLTLYVGDSRGISL